MFNLGVCLHKALLSIRFFKYFLTVCESLIKLPISFGAIAQLGERLHGMQEVGGSIPPSSTTINVSFWWENLGPHRLEA